MRIFKSIDELFEASNTDLGYSQWHEVTQENIDMFAAATGDQQWIHTDPERAATGTIWSADRAWLPNTFHDLYVGLGSFCC